VYRGEAAAQVEVGRVGRHEAAQPLDRRLGVATGEIRGDPVQHVCLDHDLTIASAARPVQRA
jgi:hypothetical protein